MSISADVTADVLVANLLDREAIRDLILHTAALLDAEQLDDWLALFGEESEYEISAYSSEIRATMSWWKSGRSELARILGEVPEHVRDPDRRFRLVAPVSVTASGDHANASSRVAIFRTTPDGASTLYALGRYEDGLVKHRGQWLYTAHRVLLETRVLDSFTHLPL